VRRRDLITVAGAVARFVRTEGYWPKAGEVGALLKAERGPVLYAIQALIDAGRLERAARAKASVSRLRLTGAGWEMLGYAPIEPWRRPPTTARINRLINLASARAMRMEEAARRQMEIASA
jgi:hypothetical protein